MVPRTPRRARTTTSRSRTTTSRTTVMTRALRRKPRAARPRTAAPLAAASPRPQPPTSRAALPSNRRNRPRRCAATFRRCPRLARLLQCLRPPRRRPAVRLTRAHLAGIWPLVGAKPPVEGLSTPSVTAQKASTPSTPLPSSGDMFMPSGVHADKAELFNIWLAERQSAEEAAGRPAPASAPVRRPKTAQPPSKCSRRARRRGEAEHVSVHRRLLRHGRKRSGAGGVRVALGRRVAADARLLTQATPPTCRGPPYRDREPALAHNHTTERRHCNITTRLSQETNSVHVTSTRDTVRPS
eukprot:3964438-Prymnesium_polylepis.1